MRINLFYPAVALVGLALVFLFRRPPIDDLSFYGFAESNETAVNYNYPIVVNEILVRPGERVSEGDALLRVSRQKSKETMADQEFRINELNAEQRLWRQRKTDELRETRERTNADVARIEEELTAARTKLTYTENLANELATITVAPADYAPLRDRIRALENELARTQVQGRDKAAALNRELSAGASPYRAQVDRLRAQAAFDSAQLVRPFIVTAPADGLIGNVNVKEDEHVQAFETLLSFYEPHSSLVSGYLHEDQTARVATGDKFEVYSLKDPTVKYPGVVTGLGSRIVSIPTRLRELPTFETYGREVIVEISPDNSFLQKEKVGLRKLSAEAPVK